MKTQKTLQTLLLVALVCLTNILLAQGTGDRVPRFTGTAYDIQNGIMEDNGSSIMIPHTAPTIGKVTIENGSSADVSTFIDDEIETPLGFTVNEPNDIGLVVSTNAGNDINLGVLSIAKDGDEFNFGAGGVAIGDNVQVNVGVRGFSAGSGTDQLNVGVYGSGKDGDFNVGVYGSIGQEGIAVAGEVILENNITGVSQITGVTASIEVTSGSSVTDAYGLSANFHDAGGTITNGYGVFIKDVFATNEYGIYQEGADDDNIFRGRMMIGAETITSGSHTDYQLAVDGKIVSKEAVVTIDNWADFVFSNDYQLASIGEVEQYIKKHQHLPGVPSEKEVLNEGVNLGEMDAILLQKIEELTLYIIAQEKRLAELETQTKN